MDLLAHELLQDAEALARDVARACDRIAPTWSLDQLIAVNPYLGWTGMPIERAEAELGLLCGTRLTMPRPWYREQLQPALAGPDADALRAALEAPQAPAGRLPLISDLREAAAPAPGGLDWNERLTHQISQHCAAFFDTTQSRWRLDTTPGLYGSWRQQLGADRGLPWRRGRRWLAARLQALPEQPQELIATALAALRVPPAARAAYLSALLLSINGWAAWCAGLRWQARLRGGGEDTHLLQLLAVRLAWEVLLLEDAPTALPLDGWALRWAALEQDAARRAEAGRAAWQLQEALETAYQQRLGKGLLAARPAEPEAVPCAVQAVFCIDVRSEPLRRALEAVAPEVRTRGFAGFFGLPIAYAPLGSELVRPQLPGLLAPAHAVGEQVESPSLAQAWRRRRQAVLQWRQRWAELRGAPASAFSYVESCGLLHGAALLADSLPSTAAPRRWEHTGLPREAREARPRLALVEDDPAAAALLARNVLHAMGLTRGFAPLLLVAGHGSQSVNNAHAASLHCGACGGQSGEVNARVLAGLLNARSVRELLRLQHGIDLPATTHVLPALHNTTTDDVTLLDTDLVLPARQGELAALRRWLEQAGQLARAERAPALGLKEWVHEPEALARALRRRANDWAQLRPEWGLAGNAAFIAAPRARSRHLRLDGRCFLHDYDWREDGEGRTLELIMTAPMVVANWINLQYHASTVDNHRWGSGNKTLHNVVGGHIGVFEGNGGDLRIGLPLQSVHDGQRLRHQPLRLSVFIEAPRAAIDAVLARHAPVRDLVQHGWLYLLRLDSEAGRVERWHGGRWLTARTAA